MSLFYYVLFWTPAYRSRKHAISYPISPMNLFFYFSCDRAENLTLVQWLDLIEKRTNLTRLP